LRITLMDFNARKADRFIGESTVSLEVGSKSVKNEIVSQASNVGLRCELLLLPSK